MIKAAIFDVDGTILDTMPMWATIAQDYLKSKGIEASNEINIKMIAFTVPQAAEYMRSQYKLNLPAEIIGYEIQKMAEDFYKFKAPMKDGIHEAIQWLYKNKIPMIVASSGVKELIEAAFKRHGISNYFKKIFIGNKSTPELFNKCLAYLGLENSAEEVLFFEDGIHAIKTAAEIGMKTVLVKDIQVNYEEIKEIADCTLEAQHWKQF